MREYFLMNKDNKILRFHLEDRIGSQACVLDMEYCQKMPIGFKNINDWVTNRNFAKHKEHLRKWLKEWQLDTTEGFLNITHGLGLNDTLWVKSVDSSLTWADVNLYHNDFSDVVEYTAFEKGLQGLKIETTSPEFTSEGTFAKCWKRRNGSIFLLKRGSEGFRNAGLEPYSEYYGAQIAGQITKECVRYDLEMFKGNLCSCCEIFTSEKEGFVPFYKFLKDDSSQDISSVLSFCSELGFEYEFRRMIFIDSVVFNQDRHLGNFGFLVDNETYEIKKFAPLFDFNMSMMSRALDEDFSLENPFSYIEQFNIEHKLGGKFNIVGKQILTDSMKRALAKNPEIQIIPHEKYNLSDDRLNKLQKAVQINYEDIMEQEQKTYSFSQDVNVKQQGNEMESYSYGWHQL